MILVINVMRINVSFAEYYVVVVFAAMLQA